MRVLIQRSAALLVCLAALGVAAPAESATVSKLRVGQHPGFTRVVFELDSAAGYRLERSTTIDGTPVVIVTLTARLGASAPRSVRSPSSLLESVSLAQPQDRTVATIRLRRANLPIKEMILRAPPRVVLDVVGEDTALAARARPKPRVAATPSPAPPKPAPAVEKPVAKPTPAVEKPIAGSEPPKPTPTPAPQVARNQPQPAVGKPTPEVEPTPRPEPPAPAASAAERAAQEAMDRRLAAVREAAEQRKRQLEEERQRREAEAQRERAEAEQRERAEAEQRQRAEEAAATATIPGEGGSNGLLIGGVVGVLLMVVIIAVVLVRRRTLPRDLDVGAIGGPGFGEPADEPGPLVLEDHSAETESAATTSSEPLFGPGDQTQAPLSAPGLFDESEKGDRAMDTHVQQLPIDRNEPIAAPAGADLTNLVAELERRLSGLESQLQESDAAHERLERQVAAQSEELRVQRAAIARTQRALRGLSRSEEEQATEPALRD